MMGNPSEKSQKYDRQLRLWGDHGQNVLEASKVCLIYATATGCEILKNLVLPGVGSFEIIDDDIVSEQDLGNNFFLAGDSLNKKRGQEAVRNLKELNDEVEGAFLDESISNLLKKSPEVFLKFSLVIASCLPKRTLFELDEYLSKHNIPLVLCRSYGMIGYLRLVVKDHTVVEAHPEHPHPDLRLTNPFSELKKFCDAINLDELDKKRHAHMPWLVILYKYLQEYQLQNGKLPQSYKDKKSLKAMISEGVRRNEFGVPEDEENFAEAVKAVNVALVEPSISSSLREILDHPCTSNITSESKNFWVLARALKEYINVHGCLPLQGSIPDMTADSETYIQLQEIYRNRAYEQVEEVHRNATEIKQSLQDPSEPIDIKETQMFCKNAAHITLIKCKNIREEYDSSNADVQFLAGCLEDDEEGNDCVYYLLLRAVDEFYEEYSRYPGCDNDRVEADIPLLKAIVSRILHDLGLNVTVREDYLHEMCSFGAAELHSVASFMGGVAAQEIIKLLTKQYIPINNAFIYNACTQTSTTVKV